jgi:hypothetical protein
MITVAPQWRYGEVAFANIAQHAERWSACRHVPSSATNVVWKELTDALKKNDTRPQVTF